MVTVKAILKIVNLIKIPKIEFVRNSILIHMFPEYFLNLRLNYSIINFRKLMTWILMDPH